MKAGPLRHAHALQAPGGRAPAGPGPAGHRRPLGPLRATGRRAASRRPKPRRGRTATARRSLRAKGGGLSDGRSEHQVPGSDAEESPGDRGLPARRSRWTISAGWKTPARPPPSSPRCSRSRSSTRRSRSPASRSSAPTASPRRSPTFPKQDEYRFGPENYLEMHRQGQEGRRHPDHRQPQRRLARRLDPLRQADPGGRRRRPGAERLLHRRRHGHDRPGGRVAIPRPGRDGEAVGLHPLGREDRAVLQLAGLHGQAPGRGRGRRAGPLQPLPPAGHRSGGSRHVAAAGAEHALRAAPAAPLGGHPPRPASMPRWPSPAASTMPKDCSRPSWPGPTWA